MTTNIKKQINDVGEKIGGAKKDLWKTRGLIVDDLKDINSRELSKAIVKKNTWPEPNYEELVKENGKKIAFLYYIIRDKMPNTIKDITKSQAEQFVKSVVLIRSELDKIKDLETEFEAFQKLLITESKKISNTSFIYMAHRISLNYLELQTEIQDLFPNYIRNEVKEIWLSVYDDKIGMFEKFSKNRGYSFNSKTEAIKYIKENLYDPVKEKSKKNNKPKNENREVIQERPDLENIERIGFDWRKGKDVTAEDLKNKFNFRGVEFGNWTNQTERQLYINHAYDGLMDLVDVLGVSPDFLSLGGYEGKKLALAFGARGSGKASAHYEKAKVVINLTKTKGAGSLAHEIAHALDDYLGIKLGYKNYASIDVNPRCEVSKAIYNIINLIIEDNKDLVEVLNTMETKLPKSSRKEYKEISNRFELNINIKNKEGLKENLEELKTYFKRYRQSDLIDKFIDKVEKEVNSFQAGKLSFYGNAVKLDARKSMGSNTIKKYFSLEIELFARAFEAYVEDKIIEKGNVSQYLVHGTDNKELYPQGQERKSINEQFDKLFEVLKRPNIFKDTPIKEKADETDLDELKKYFKDFI